MMLLTRLDLIKERLRQAVAGGAHSRRIEIVRPGCDTNRKREAHASLFLLVPLTGLEPVRGLPQRILSPRCLPIPS